MVIGKKQRLQQTGLKMFEMWNRIVMGSLKKFSEGSEQDIPVYIAEIYVATKNFFKDCELLGGLGQIITAYDKGHSETNWRNEWCHPDLESFDFDPRSFIKLSVIPSDSESRRSKLPHASSQRESYYGITYRSTVKTAFEEAWTKTTELD